MQQNSPLIGVLLMNLGTPEAPTPAAVKTYLREFLSDPRVVDVNPWIWKPVLNGIILNTRPRKVAKVYQEVWMEEGSPLLVLGQRLTDKLAQRLNANQERYVVAKAMTYGAPSVESAGKLFREKGVEKIFVLPMYPQFSRSTTAAAYDRLMASLKRCPHWPALNLLQDYADHPRYIEALVQTIKAQWQEQGEQRHLLFSYHGVPKRYVTEGDPYQRRCEATTQAVVAKLGLSESEYTHVYQSRFGREEWLKPYADETMRALPGKGITAINVISPAFAIDCIETLEEIDMQLRDEFLAAGGERFDYIAALNDSADQVALYETLVHENTQHWI
ncbi:ferrochelatase [Marinomonas ostreistagni]|uniref:ferrochelatase n=1 Tax=Marinomonas ostreistagni TaxID=359209 RepID=UPI00194E39D3|nr:ferrochelatase [Marinomonas ostreistagni]MBM6550026.1 ferrochelatase [Marinomonas ostreistagni]